MAKDFDPWGLQDERKRLVFILGTGRETVEERLKQAKGADILAEQRLNQILKDIDETMLETSKQAAEQVGVLGAETFAAAMAKAMSITKTPSNVSFAGVNELALEALVKEQTENITEQAIRFGRRVGGEVRKLQLSELSKMLATGQTSKELSASLYDVLAKSKGDEFLNIIGGNSVMYKDGSLHGLEDYADMVGRTLESEASRESTLLVMNVSKVTFLQVSSHAGACEVCVPFQDKIFAMSQNSKGIPIAGAGDLPPYHPRCLHVIIPRPDLQ